MSDSSLGVYDKVQFQNNVIDFPISKAYKNSISSLIDICKSIHAWLLLDTKNVAVIHCFDGMEKTCTAVSSYLCFSRIFSNAHDALTYFKYRRRVAVIQDSVAQDRYVDYFDTIVRLQGNLQNPYPLTISEIAMNGIPIPKSGLDSQGVIGIEIYENRYLVLTTLKKAQTPQTSVKIYADKTRIVFNLATNLTVERDVQIRFFRHVKSETDNYIVTIASFSFHTGFLPMNGKIRVSKNDLEIAARGGNSTDFAFPADFSIDINVFGGERTANQPTISYPNALETSLPQCLRCLATFHGTKADEVIVEILVRKGYPRYLSYLCCSLSNNAEAYALLMIEAIFTKHLSLASELDSPQMKIQLEPATNTEYIYQSSEDITSQSRPNSSPSPRNTRRTLSSLSSITDPKVERKSYHSILTTGNESPILARANASASRVF